MFDQNQRRYPRANYPCQLTMWFADGRNEIILANTANIGLGGLCVHLNQHIQAGTKLDIQLQFNDTSTPFKCKGVVVRCDKDDEKYFNTGIQFETLSELKEAFLSGKISEILDREKKGKS